MTIGLWIALAVACGLVGFAAGVFVGAYYTNGEFTEYRDDEENSHRESE